MPAMAAILFAGGVGQRLWPLSRRNSPKQFVPLIGDKSSFQLAVDRLAGIVPPERIYVGTNRLYAGALQEQAAAIPPRNFFLEPARRDVAAAVALAFFSIERDGVSGPVLFQWTDNYVKNSHKLLAAIRVARQLIDQDERRVIFIGERPRFANENLGWIELGDELGCIDGMPYYSYRSWKYRPPKDVAVQMYSSGRYVWNSGYFVTSVGFMTSAFRRLAPELASKIGDIVAHRGAPDEQQVLDALYPAVPALHFDQAILEPLSTAEAVLLPVELGWSDPGSLPALKETLEDSPEATVSHGDVVQLETTDCLIYNQNAGKPVAAMGIEGIIVVETPEVTLVIHKDSVRHIARLLERMSAQGWDHLL
jgi:mannose-1-phosphate guanylyltransferase